ncbi:MAG TPA: hypothetical protein VGM90_33660 [Kofleriaceae bacterium]
MRAIALASLVAGCGTQFVPEVPPTFTDVYAELFPRQTISQCVFCHANPPNEISNGMFSVGDDQTTAYPALMDISHSAKCGDTYTLIVPGDPDASLVYQKLALDPPPCGDRMPLGNDAISKTKLKLVRDWILAGAKDD